ncbi:ABC transporter permease [Dongshaea marina]|uniref:ABC transporter permease n=1 Tax=Dongshaea marina TaxID=2047966 RepID=UPI001900EC8A|nr:ABC transporter permease subunit [Dongshaea marina]
MHGIKSVSKLDQFSAQLSRILKMRFNYQDLPVLIIAGSCLWLYLVGWHDMHTQFLPDSQLAPITLDPATLPYYTLRTSMRLIIGMLFSFVFAIVAGYACAKNKHIARIILPLINFMESAPLIGFLTFTTAFFVFLFPNNLMGLEAAAIFGVFTGQAWNMALVFYQTLRIIPRELEDAARTFHLNAWQKLWRIELPYSVPGLLWNTMVSQSAAWFALVATEAIPLGGRTVMLPGVGSYIQLALDKASLPALLFAVLAIVLNIILFDQLLFRPLVKWSEKFKYESIRSQRSHSSWFYNLITRGVFTHAIGSVCQKARYLFVNTPTLIARRMSLKAIAVPQTLRQSTTLLWYGVIITACIYYGHLLWDFYPSGSMGYLIPLMFKTSLRVAVAMLLSIVIFTPLGIWIGLNPRLTRICQPVIQIMAALPPNIFFPAIILALLITHQPLNLWTIPLIMLGTQWYVLFNVIAGASSIPQDLLEMARSFRICGWNWWFKFMIPVVFPYVVTGIISAAGGAWNSAIAGEFLQWGSKTIAADGLGALIAQTSADNQLPQAALAVSTLCFLVALCVIFIWKPLYRLAETRYKV